MKYLVLYENFKVDIKYEYQYRDIDAGVWYKREIGSDMWCFITEDEFNENNYTNETY